MLRKILEKVLITKKFTQCKESRTLKIDAFEIPDKIKILKKCFQNMNCFSWIKLIPALILQFPLPRTFLTISIKFNPSQLEPLFNKILITFFISFPALYYPIGPHVTANIGYAKPYTKPSQSNLLSSCIQIIIPYGSNTLPIKSWVFKSYLFFRVRRHGQQQLYFQYKVCWSFYRMVGFSIIFTILFVHSTTPIICKKNLFL